MFISKGRHIQSLKEATKVNSFMIFKIYLLIFNRKSISIEWNYLKISKNISDCTYLYNIRSKQQQLLLASKKISRVMGMIDKRLKDQSQFCLLRDVFVEQSIFLMGNLLYHFLRCILVCVIPCITKSILFPLYILFELFFILLSSKKLQFPL